MQSGDTSRIAPTVLALFLLFDTSIVFSQTSLELNRGFGVNESLDATAIARPEGWEREFCLNSEIRSRT
jgi:hypothetical protein